MRRTMPFLVLLAALLAVGCSSAPTAPPISEAAAGVPITVEPLPEGPVDDGPPYQAYVLEPSKNAPAPPEMFQKVDPREKSHWPEMPISEEEAENLRAASAFLPPNPSIVQIQRATPGGMAPAVNSGFESLSFADDPGGVPPDPEIAAGLNHVIVVVNTSIEIHEKDGTTVAGYPQTLGTFFSGVPGCTGLFDPNVLYDDKEDRYFVGVDSAGTGYCFAVSQTGDPEGAWNGYRFGTGPLFFDFPHAGIGEEAIVMGANLFSGGFVRSDVWAINKADAYSGASITPVVQTIGGDTPQPVHFQGFPQGTWPSGTEPAEGPPIYRHYIVNDDAFDGTSYGIWEWVDPFNNSFEGNTLTRIGAVDLNSATGVTAGFPVAFPQAGSAALMQGNDWRCQDAEYRNGSVWMAHTLACNPGGGTVNCVRWAEIEPETATVIQAGVVASDGEFRQFPNLAVNDNDDMILGYTLGSTSIFPSVAATGRLGTDPLDTVQDEVLLKAGEVAYTGFDGSPHRWGDYTEACHDPDGVTLWYVGDYSEDTGLGTTWGNYVASLSFDGGAVFEDGFESGDTSVWSSTTP